MTEQTALYRFFSTGGQLLYVGITRNPPGRFGQHGSDKDWWDQVSGITVEWHPSRQAALDAEQRAIRVEHPKHNVVHNRRPKPASRQGDRPRSGGRHTVPHWICDECGQEVRGKSGYIHVSYFNIEEHRRTYREFKEREREAKRGLGQA